MSIIDCFAAETPHVKSPWMKENVISLIWFVSLDQIPNMKICHMVACQHPEVVEGRQCLIDTNIIDPEDTYYYGSIDDDDDALDKEDDSGLGEAGLSTGVTGV